MAVRLLGGSAENRGSEAAACTVCALQGRVLEVRVRQGLADLFKSTDGDGGPSGAARAGRRQGFRRYPSQRAVRDPTAFPASQVRHGMAHPFRVAEEM